MDALGETYTVSAGRARRASSVARREVLPTWERWTRAWKRWSCESGWRAKSRSHCSISCRGQSRAPDAAADGGTHFLRLLSETMHSTSSSLQLVHGAPCSTTLQRTFLDRQHWQALEALRFTLFAGRMPFGFSPAASAVRFCWACGCCLDGSGGGGGAVVDDESDGDSDDSEGVYSMAVVPGRWHRNRVAVGLWDDVSKNKETDTHARLHADEGHAAHITEAAPAASALG